MLLDGGKLKEIKIKLFLSSRTEMLKVIEQARQQAIKLQSMMSNSQSSQSGSQSKDIVTSKEEIKEEQDEGAKIREKDDEGNNKRDKRDRSTSRDRGRGVRARSKEGDRQRDRSRGRDRRDRERDRRRRDRSRSRDRYRNRRSRSRDKKRSARGDSKERRGRSKDSDNDKIESPNAKNETNQSWEGNPQPSQQPPVKAPLLPDPPALPQMLLQMQQNGKDAMQPNQVNPSGQANSMNYGINPDRRFGAVPHVASMGNFPGMPAMRGREGWPAMAGPMGPMPVPLDPTQMALARPPMMMPDMPLSSFPPPGFPTQPMFPHGEGFDPMWRMMAQASDSNRESSPEVDACIEIRGLPLNVSYIDVKKLFDGLSIPSDGIKMINDNQGNRTGIAYVKFSSTAQKKSALNQHGKKVRSNIVEVLHLREDLYRAAVDNFKPEKDAIVKEVDMDIDNGESSDSVWPKENRRERGRERKFQDPYRINPAMDFKKQDGRPDSRPNRGDRPDRGDRDNRSERFDRFDRQDRMDRSERMDRPDRIDRNERMDRGPRMDRQGRFDRGKPDESTAVVIKGLPNQCNERSVLDFFSELGIVPVNINITPDHTGQALGEAHCEFETEDEASKALTKNGANMGRFTVTVESVPDENFGGRNSYQWKPMVPYQNVNAPPGLLPTPPPQYQQYRVSRFEDKGPDRSPYSNEDRYPKGERFERGMYGMNNRYNNSRLDGENNGGGGGMRGGRGGEGGRGGRGGGEGRGGRGEGRGAGRGRSRFSGGPPLMNNMDGIEPLMSGMLGGSRPPRGGPPNSNALQTGAPYIDGDIVENFGKPGCVVAIENLHFRADIDEIIGLFSEFDVEHEDVIRRFDERGRPTGDARVCLKSPAEAMRAIRELAYSQLRGRTLKLTVLS